MCGIHTPLGSMIITVIAHNAAKEELLVYYGLKVQTISLLALLNPCSVLNKQNSKVGGGRVFDAVFESVIRAFALAFFIFLICCTSMQSESIVAALSFEAVRSAVRPPSL